MSDWAAWFGMAGTFIFGGISVIQFLQWLKERSHREGLKSIRNQLGQLRTMCMESIDKAEVIKTDPARQWVRTLLHTIVMIEDQLTAILGDRPKPKPPNRL